MTVPDQSLLAAPETPVFSDAFFNVVSAFLVALLILFGLFTEYGTEAIPHKAPANSTAAPNVYAMFQDINVMLFIGFGFLMTFLEKYGLSSVGFNFLVTVVAILWNTLLSGETGFFYFMYNGGWHTIGITIMTLVQSDFGAACCLISMGAVLGKANPTQLVVMVFFEVIFYNLNLVLCLDWLSISDQGDSITVHIFGAFFGLAVAWVISHRDAHGHDKDCSSRTSDLFAMIGTVFLWAFWPSFNAAGIVDPSQQTLVILNTVLSLCGSAIATFILTGKLRGTHRFNMVDVQNATLAGGVAVGTMSNMLIGPIGALIVGVVSGAFCVFGYVSISPFLTRTIGLHDTCGVANLHGYSGVISGLGSAIAVAAMSKEKYGDYYDHFFENHSSQSKAALTQVVGVVLTLFLSITTGLASGKVIKMFGDDRARGEYLFEDSGSWDLDDGDVRDEGGEALIDPLTKQGATL